MNEEPNTTDSPEADHATFAVADHTPAAAPDVLSEHQCVGEKDAAKVLGLAPKTLRNMRADGRGPMFVALKPGSIGYRVVDLVEYVKSRRVRSTKQARALYAEERPPSAA